MPLYDNWEDYLRLQEYSRLLDKIMYSKKKKYKRLKVLITKRN